MPRPFSLQTVLELMQARNDEATQRLAYGTRPGPATWVRSCCGLPATMKNSSPN
jgi:hypothetical protein